MRFLVAYSLLITTTALQGMWDQWAKISKDAETYKASMESAAAEAGRRIENAKLLARLKGDYNDAVTDTKQADIEEISTNLKTIMPWAKDLIWNKDRTRILMVSWVPDWAAKAFFQPALEKRRKDPTSLYATPAVPGVYMWTTLVPEVKNFAAQYMKTRQDWDLPLYLRLQQYLGLPPRLEGAQSSFVEVWVRPQDLFRPCPDAEVIDSACFVDSLNIEPKAYADVFNFIQANPEHKKWFDERKATSYSGAYPFPWTRLGYTYDWGSEKVAKKYGASEFAVKQGSQVVIHDIYPTDAYPATTTPATGSVSTPA